MDAVYFKGLVGKTLTSVSGAAPGSGEITFTCDDGSKYRMNHSQDCCESVSVEDICGDIDDLIGSPIIQSDESSSDENPDGASIPEYQEESFTWTFYRIATANGLVVIRWYGSSNGYYSESVYFTAV